MVTKVPALYFSPKKALRKTLSAALSFLCVISFCSGSINAMQDDTTQEEAVSESLLLGAFTKNGEHILLSNGWDENTTTLGSIAYCNRADFYRDTDTWPTINESALHGSDAARLSQSCPSISLIRTAHYKVQYRNSADDTDELQTRITITPIEDASKEYVYTLPNNAAINGQSCVAATELEKGNLLIAYSSENNDAEAFLHFIDVANKNHQSMQIPGAQQLLFSSQKCNGSVWLTLGVAFGDDTFKTYMLHIVRDANGQLKIASTKDLPHLCNKYGGGTGWARDGKYLLVAQKNQDGKCIMHSYCPQTGKLIAQCDASDIALPEDELHFPLDVTPNKAHALVNKDIIHTERSFAAAHALYEAQQKRKQTKNLALYVFGREIGKKS